MGFDGNKLKKQRKKCELSLDRLGLLANSSKSYIWELEKGKIEPSGLKVYMISQALGVEMEFFYGEVDTTKEVLGTLISWLGRELGAHNVKSLLNKLHGGEALDE